MARKALLVLLFFIFTTIVVYICFYQKIIKSDELVLLHYDQHKPPVYQVKIRGGYKILQNYIVPQKR